MSKPLPEPAYQTYVVDEPDYENEAVHVVTVDKANDSVDQLEVLLRKLLVGLTPTVPPPVKAPEESTLEKLVRLLVLETSKKSPTRPAPVEPAGLDTLLRSYLTEQQPLRQQPRLRPIRRDWPEMKCFSCGKTGHGVNRCPALDTSFPFILPGWKAEKTQMGFLMMSPKMATDWRRAENED